MIIVGWDKPERWSIDIVKQTAKITYVQSKSRISKIAKIKKTEEKASRSRLINKNKGVETF